MAVANEKKPTIPYLPFKTFLNTLDSLAAFMPEQIDATLWATLSGGIKSQLLSTYRFFGLIDSNGIPSPELKKLADDKAGRPALLLNILKRSYSDLMRLDLTKATPGSFDAELRKYGQEGDTHRKAASFFLAAAKFAGVPLSPLLMQRGSLAVTRTKRPRTSVRKNGAGGNTVTTYVSAPTGAASARHFRLPGGTVITIATTNDAFHMSTDDRKIVFGLLDTLEQYRGDDSEEGSDQE